MIGRVCRDVHRVVLACVCLVSAASLARGQTRPSRPPRNPKTPGSQGTAGRTRLPTSGAQTLPAWLDDAETLDKDTASVELSVGRWSTVDGGETDGPIVDAAVGVTDWLQLEAAVPYYRVQYSDGFSASGLGDTYLSAKLQLLDPADYPVGVSVTPLVEILSKASVSDITLGLSRVNFGLPITVQVGSDDTRTRAYASAGWFSRHAVFVGSGVERDVGSAVTLIGLLSYTYSTAALTATDLAGLSRSRTDATGLVYVSVSKLATLFVGAGRTVSRLDQNGASFIGSVGVRFETSRPQTKRP